MKRLFLFCPLISCILTLQGQAPSLDRVAAPSSPTAASLSRYVDFPVTMSSGLPNISIPLYEFKSSRITVPISLSYHAGGIRVTDRTSTLGLGWSLIAGGAITRAIAGLPDENGYGFFSMDYPDDLSEDFSGFYYEHHDLERDLSRISCFVNRVNNAGANNGKNYDYSADNYYYNAQGLSGQFSFSTDKTLHTFPYDPIKIQCNLTTGEVPFIITATDGVTYEFGKPVENGKTPATDYISVDNSPNYASAWYLTKIISADKSDTVTFRYSIDVDSYMNTSVTSTMRAGYDATAVNFYTRQMARVTKSQSNSTEYNVRLLDITGKNGRVHFNYGEETVNSYHWGNTSTLFPSTIRPISSIEVYNNTGSEVKIKQFNLQYSFFNSVPSHAPNSLRLDRVTEIGFSQGSSQIAPPYIISYVTDDVPPFNTNSRDLWGYYNAYTSFGDDDNMLLVNLPSPLLDADGYREPVDAFQKRGVNPSVLDKGMLKSISYPTGGYTNFTFEPNSKSSLEHVVTPQNNNCLIRTAMGEMDKTFTPASNGYNRTLEFKGRLATCCSPYVENVPQVILLDITTNTTIINTTLSALVSGTKTDESYSISLPNLNPAHTYRLYFPMPSNMVVGQYLRYDLYAHFIEELPPVISTNEKLIYAGGLRIKSIEHRDNVTSEAITKKYNYTESYWNSDAFTGNFNSIKTAFGKRLYLPTQDLRNISGTNITVTPKAASYIYQEAPTYSIGSPSSSVSYSKVEEIQVSADNKPLGKTEYTFNTGIDMVTTGIGTGINWRQQVKVDRSFIRSQLLNKKIYKSQGDDWELIQETQNFYNNINDLTFDTKGNEYIKKYITAYLFDDALWTEWAGKSPYPISSVGAEPMCPLYPAATPISFNTLFLNIVRPTLESTIISDLGISGNWIVNKATYTYMNHHHMKPSEITSTKSDGSTITQQIRYSTDIYIPYEGQGNAGWGSNAPKVIQTDEPVFSGIINLQLANITTPIETTTFLRHKGEETNYLLESTFNYHNPLLPVIDSVATIDLSIPSNQFVGANIFDGPIDYNTENLILDRRYKTQVDFRYNAKGSLIQQHKANNIDEILLWGYNQSYPVIKADNIDYTSLSNAVASIQSDFESFLTNSIGDMTTDTQKAAWRTFNTSLRNALPDKTIISTYTYNPLIGMTSQTDPNGVTTYYEYDSFGRLMNIRDSDQNILKHYDYHYKQ